MGLMLKNALGLFTSFKDTLIDLSLSLLINDIFNFKGYTNRKDYILTIIYVNAIFINLVFLASYISNILSLILLVWFSIAIVSLNVRRYRDADRSPWWSIFLYAPGVMFIIVAITSANTLMALETTLVTLGIPFAIAAWLLFGKSKKLKEVASDEERVLIIILTTLAIYSVIRSLMFLNVDPEAYSEFLETIDQNIKIEQTYNTAELKLDRLCENIYNVEFTGIQEEEKAILLEESLILAEKIAAEEKLVGDFDLVYYTDLASSSLYLDLDEIFSPTEDLLNFCYENSSLERSQ
jgi:uncharacterized membrane protein YhaH (DUF805 family)